ncbi:secreted RxLR effector protein 161-like [Andrographis paniculata]|uniref:secreted RxLR effector protein 161-like n=1 Tax=Andrographis paniculata TaxID=175694 RepID=UPI0021E79327|nr:secreted RxLR effector protein 161-like [Andrographis paniculata]
MTDAKPSDVPLASNFILSKDQCPKSENDVKYMLNVPHTSAIGSIMYLMVCTRPDLAYSISCLSRYMANPVVEHWNALKCVFKYLVDTIDVGLVFGKHISELKLNGYVDSNYANDRDSRKSTMSYIFTLCGSCVSWKSQLQHIVALSTTESEYVAITEALKEADLFFTAISLSMIYIDRFLTPSYRDFTLCSPNFPDERDQPVFGIPASLAIGY